jgi:hypothetical protein
MCWRKTLYLLIMNSQLRIAMDKPDQNEIARLLKVFSEAYVENDGKRVKVAL